jgi:hypothetical protein
LFLFPLKFLLSMLMEILVNWMKTVVMFLFNHWMKLFWFLCRNKIWLPHYLFQKRKINPKSKR